MNPRKAYYVSYIRHLSKHVTHPGVGSDIRNELELQRVMNQHYQQSRYI